MTDLNLFTTGDTGIPYAMGFADLEAMVTNLFADAANVSIAPSTVKWKISSLRIESRIKNMTNVPVQIRLYDILVRRDDEGSIALPSAVWNNGIIAQANAGVGITPTNTFPGAEPFESREFCQRFNVVKKTTFHLGAGSEHVHVIKGSPPWLNDRAISAQFSVMGKRSRFLLMVVEGGVTNETDVVPGAAGVNYSKLAVDVVTEYKAKFYALEKNRTVYTTYSNLQVLTDEVTITEDADTVAPVVIA